LVTKKEEKLQWPSIMGPAKKKLLNQLPSKFVVCEMVEDLKKLWKVCIHIAYNNR